MIDKLITACNNIPVLFVYDFDVEVGNREKHSLHFHYSKWLGEVYVKSDGVDLARTRVFINPQAPILNMIVGQNEKHDVRFDIRPNWAFFIKPTINVYVDNKLVKTY